MKEIHFFNSGKRFFPLLSFKKSLQMATRGLLQINETVLHFFS